MFTSMDKALVALVGAILFLINYFGGPDWYSEGVMNTISVVLAALTPALTYWVPNKGMKVIEAPEGTANPSLPRR